MKSLLSLLLLTLCAASAQEAPARPAQTYLEQCVQALDLARDPRTQLLPGGVTTCEAKALGPVQLKKPSSVQSSTVQVSADRLDFQVTVTETSGLTLSSEADALLYNRLVLQRAARRLAFDRAAQAYGLECYKAISALFAEQANLAALPPTLTTCESQALGAYRMTLAPTVRSSRVYARNPKVPPTYDNLGVEVQSVSGTLWVWDGRAMVPKP